MKTKVFNQTGKEISEVTLEKDIFNIKPHNQAMFDTIISHQASLRQGTSKVKNRSDVSGGGKKPWKQKGTGRARQGTTRAPQWVGGGVVFGPSPKSNYLKKVNKKVKKLAFLSFLSKKAKDKNIIVIDEIKFAKPSTKKMIEMIKHLKLENTKTLIITENFVPNVYYSLSNVGYLDYTTPTGINILDLAYYTKLIITQKALEKLTKGLK